AALARRGGGVTPVAEDAGRPDRRRGPARCAGRARLRRRPRSRAATGAWSSGRRGEPGLLRGCAAPGRSLILVDEPRWPARGRLWSHLVSDVSYEELH